MKNDNIQNETDIPPYPKIPKIPQSLINWAQIQGLHNIADPSFFRHPAVDFPADLEGEFCM